MCENCHKLCVFFLWFVTQAPLHKHRRKKTTTKRTTKPPQKHRHKNTTTQTRPHHHKNTTTKRPAREHQQKKISKRTPPQTRRHKNTTTKNTSTKTPPHHHKNTTSARRCSATHMLIYTKHETAYSYCVLHFRVALICVFVLCSAYFFMFCNLGLHTDTDKRKNLKTYTHTNSQYVFRRYIVKSMSLAGSPPK